MNEDYVVRALAADGQIRAMAVNGRGLAEEARKRHNTSPVISAALGRLLCAGAMLSTDLKNETDRLTLKVKGDGPAGAIYVVANGRREVKGFAENQPDRCYLCKKEIFGGLIRAAAEEGITVVAEGSNVDDDGDYRPGHIAIRELGVRSPLREAGLTKAEIRQLSAQLGLPTASKPSFACLATRFPYGERITKEKLQMVDAAEQYLLDLGFAQLRVRMHGDMARIELLSSDFGRFMQEEIRIPVYNKLKALGFSYISLDLAGYRTGSMNEVLSEEILEASR